MIKTWSVGVIGLGFVGQTMYDNFKNKGLIPETNLFDFDKYKQGGIGSFQSCLNTDILFLALPTPYDTTLHSYDTSSIYATCEQLVAHNYTGIIVIKSTVEPGTTKTLSSKYPSLILTHNPEFLSVRTAYEDFDQQKHIVIGYDDDKKNIQNLYDFYEHYYNTAHISLCSTIESESMKLFCNSFYAVKVQFFTELYLLCQKNGCDYNMVKSLMIKNGWVNPMHTIVPGPDGQVSYGGFCFPKDTNALNDYMLKQGTPNGVLQGTITERNQMRTDHLNCQ
jgi:UDPglucose 6-dehydrogenase